MEDYSGKTVLVSGASKGLGHVAAAAYAAAGARLYLTARSGDKLDALCETLPEADSHRCHAADLTDANAIQTMVDDLLDNVGAPDIVIHAVGGGLGMHDPLLDAGQWSTLLATNLGAGAEINRLLLPHMSEDGAEPRYIVHVGSTASTEAIASVGYNTVKAALSAYVRSLGNTYAGTNVIISGILPGAFYAPENSWRRLERNKPEVVKKFIEDRLPRGLIAEASEILPLLFLLTGPGASMMAGTCVAIDAGESKAYAG